MLKGILEKREEGKKRDKSIGAEDEMSFLDHLEELRWHLLRIGIAIAVGTIVAFTNTQFFFQLIILGPSKNDFWTYTMLCQAAEYFNSPALCIDNMAFKIQSRQMSGQFMMHITSSFIIGLVVAFPYIFWELWRFVKPGLYEYERKAARGATFYVSLLFILGTMFGYYIVAPLSINFLASYQLDPNILNEFDIVSYVSTVTMLVLSTALIFQLPVLVYFLAAVGLVTPTFMVKYRRHAIVIVLIIAAIITPPDIVSQILVSIPLSILYEISIGIARRVERRKKREEALAGD